MAVRRIAKTDGSFGWATGDNNWGTRVNETLKRVAYQTMSFAADSTLNDAPSTNPVEGTVYLVGASPTGAFASFAPNTLAVYGSSPPDYNTLSYLNYIPYAGWNLWLINEYTLFVYDGGAWIQVYAPPP